MSTKIEHGVVSHLDTIGDIQSDCILVIIDEWSQFDHVETQFITWGNSADCDTWLKEKKPGNNTRYTKLTISGNAVPASPYKCIGRFEWEDS